MDAFYASVEQRDNPDLRGLPVVVGMDHERGVISAASYEARKFGVRSAMSSVVAKTRCPDLVFVRPRFGEYERVSSQIMSIFREYTQLVEPLSLDEAFLDVTQNYKSMNSATEIAREIKQRIVDETQLTASAGISYNKFLAKLASDMHKPDGLTVIRPEQAEEVINQLNIEKFFGIGQVTAEKMHKLGIFTGADLKKADLSILNRYFGKQGHFFYQMVRGIDEREVNPDRVRKSVGAERTFEKDLSANFELVVALYQVEMELLERLKESSFRGKTLTLKIKFHNFEQITRSKTIAGFFDSQALIHKYAKDLFYQAKLDGKSIRLLGLSLSNSKEELGDGVQLTLDL